MRARFSDRRFAGVGEIYAGYYEIYVAVELVADGLRARFDGVLFSPWERDDLVDFLDELVADFRGWTGRRTWKTNNLTLEAGFSSGGHIQLDWTLLPELLSPSWRVTVTTWIEAGEQMSALATDARVFLTPPQPARR